MDVSWKVYVALSLMMFFQFAIWGAWAPVLAARLLGPLKMSGKQTGWIYNTLPIACIISPLIAGQLADKYFHVEHMLIAAHFIAAILMFVAVRQKTFGGLFVAMLGWSLCYAATLPLVNAALFAHMKEFAKIYPSLNDVSGTVFIWAPIGWAVVGYSLSGWRMLRSGESDGSDAMLLAGALGLAMAACCCLLPATPPANSGGGAVQQIFEKLIKEPDFLLFIITSLFVAGTMQFYFLGSGQYMMDRGISGKAVPGAMALAQAAQAIATWYLLGWAREHLGFKWTLTLGTSCWLLLYLIYAARAPRPVLFVSQILHGLAYVLFMIVTQVYCGAISTKENAGSMQGLIFAVTAGVGLFLGTLLAGFAMDKHTVGGKFQWPKIWTYPLVITLAGTLAFAAFFHAAAK